jgi:hypothetical protein
LTRGRLGHAARDEPLDRGVEMEPHLLVHLTLDVVLTDESARSTIEE